MKNAGAIRNWRRGVAALLLCALCAGPLQAQTDRVFVDVAVNGEAQGRMLAVLRDGDVLLTETDLQRLHLASEQPPCTHEASQCFLSLSSLKNELTFSFDERNLVVSITQNAASLPRRRISMLDAPGQAQGEFLRGAVVNYSLHAAPRTPLSGVVSQRLNIRQDVVLDNSIGRTVTGQIVRGDSSLTIDDAKAMRRTIVGDAQVAGFGATGAPMELAGIAIGREFSLDPYQPAFPMPSMQATITEPSQADIYVNGLLVKSVALSPGNYDLADIPVQAGYSNAQVVIRNRFGVVSKDVNQYGAPMLLRKGLTDYQYAVGFVRRDQTAGIHGYGPPAASMRYRIGTSAYTTVGADLQASHGEVTGSVDYAAIWRFGVVHASLGASSATTGAGDVLDVGYATSGRRNATSIEVRSQSRSYQSIGANSGYQPTSNTLDVTHTERFDGNTTASLGLHYAAYRDGTYVRDIVGGIQRRLGDWNVSLGYSSSIGSFARGVHALTVTVTRALNVTTTQTMTAQAGGQSGISTVVSHAASSPFDTSYALGVTRTAGTPASFAGTGHFGTEFLSGNANVAIDSGRSEAVSADVAGAVVLADRHVLFSQPVDDGYALISSNGIPRAPVYVNGRFAGRTDRAGYAIVPSLASNEVSDVAISSTGLPLQDEVDDNDRRVSPGYHAGNLVRFSAHRIHAIIGVLKVRNAKHDVVIPQYGDAVLMNGAREERVSPVDESGRVYFDRIDYGAYSLTITYDGGTCTTTVRIPEFSGPSYDMGAIECVE